MGFVSRPDTTLPGRLVIVDSPYRKGYSTGFGVGHGGPLWRRVLILSLTGEAKLWTLGDWACAPVEFVLAYAALFKSIKEQVERLKSLTIHVLRIHRSRRNKR